MPERIWEAAEVALEIRPDLEREVLELRRANDARRRQAELAARSATVAWQIADRWRDVAVSAPAPSVLDSKVLWFAAGVAVAVAAIAAASAIPVRTVR